MPKIKVKGKIYKINNSLRKDKEYVVNVNGKKIHFADPNLKEFPGTKRGDNYCARSLGIAKKYNIKNDLTSPNYWSRKLWSCKGDKSVSKKKFYKG